MDQLTKTLDAKFCQLCGELKWPAYGGDESLYFALKKFLDAIPNGDHYNCRELEQAVGCSTAWMLIYAFVDRHWIAYGVSPREGWLEHDGLFLKRYASPRTAEDMCKTVYADKDDRIGTSGYHRGQ